MNELKKELSLLNQSGMQGCGKLGYNFIKRLTSRHVKGPDGNTYPGASRFELLSVIYLSQVADQSGFVSQFPTKEFSEVIGCSIRETYVIVHNLVKKGYASASYYNGEKWSGIKDIRLIGNDFSKVKKYNGSTRYISSFYSFFDFTDEHYREALQGLSLYALRLLLNMLFSYDKDLGIPRISFQTMMDMAGVSSRSLILSYLGELTALFGKDYFFVTGSRRVNYYMAHIRKSPLFIPETRPAENQMGYYKRRWLCLIHSLSIAVDPRRDLHYYLNLIFNTIYSAIMKGTLLEAAESMILSFIEKNGYWMDEISIIRAGTELAYKGASPGTS